MSRLSKAIRNIALGPIVARLVRLAESLLGAGTGGIKKKLVMEVMAIILKRMKEAGKQVPENVDYVVDELVEQTVSLLNETGEFGAPAPAEPVTAVPTPAAKTIRKPRRRRGAAAPVVDDTDDDFDITDLDIDDETDTSEEDVEE